MRIGVMLWIVAACHLLPAAAWGQHAPPRRLLSAPAQSSDFTFGPANYQLADGTQQRPSWALDRIDQRTAPLDSSYAFANTATAVSIYVLDTGVRSKHVEFEKYTAQEPARGGASRVVDVYKATGSERYSDAGKDCSGHGTHVASVAAGVSSGVAKGAQIKAMRVLDCNGEVTSATLARSIEWLAEEADLPAVALVAMGELTAVPTVNAAIQRCANQSRLQTPETTRTCCHFDNFRKRPDACKADLYSAC